VRGVTIGFRPVGVLVIALARPPPAARLDPAACGSARSTNHPDTVAEMIGDRRHVRVPAPGPHDAVHPAAPAGPEGDLLGLDRVIQPVHGQSGGERRARRGPVRELLVIDEQHARRRPGPCGCACPAGPATGSPARGGRDRSTSRMDVPIPLVPMCPTYSVVALPEDLHAVAVAAQVVLGPVPAGPQRSRGVAPWSLRRPGQPPGPRAKLLGYPVGGLVAVERGQVCAPVVSLLEQEQFGGRAACLLDQPGCLFPGDEPSSLPMTASNGR